jgi:hypothetical protein
MFAYSNGMRRIEGYLEACLAGRDSAGAMEARTMISGGVQMCAGGRSGVARRSSSRRAPSRPILSCEIRIVVNGGCTMSIVDLHSLLRLVE